MYHFVKDSVKFLCCIVFINKYPYNEIKQYAFPRFRLVSQEKMPMTLEMEVLYERKPYPGRVVCSGACSGHAYRRFRTEHFPTAENIPERFSQIDFSSYDAAYDLGEVEVKNEDGSIVTCNRIAYVGTQDIALEDGSVEEIGFTTYENQPVGVDFAKISCSGGNHAGKEYVGSVDTRRIHHPDPHPCQCTEVYTHEWRCTVCGSSGTERWQEPVWCLSPDIQESPTLPDEPGPA